MPKRLTSAPNMRSRSAHSAGLLVPEPSLATSATVVAAPAASSASSLTPPFLPCSSPQWVPRRACS